MYAPIGLLVDYVNALLRHGLADTQILRDLIDLYALDFYEGQVRNGGHSQYIANSGDALSANMEHALRGAELLKLDALAQIITECRNWCAANADERDQQNGFSVRAAPLEALDTRLYEVEFDDAGFAGFIAAQPRAVQDWVKAATDGRKYLVRSQYHLAAAAWLLTHPNTRLVPDAEVLAVMKEIAEERLA